MCVTLNVLTNTYKTLKINNADVDCILLNILNYCNLVINPLHACCKMQAVIERRHIL